MIRYIEKLVSLFGGLFICAVSIVIAINANIGLGPWNALHVGITRYTPLTVGNVQILVGLTIVLISTLMKQVPGWGTLANMIFVGMFVDLVNKTGIVPNSHQLLSGILMLVMSLFLMGLGSYLYMRAQIGAGPRDGLMVGLVKKTGKPVWLIRNSIESVALITGILLGAPIGIGTVIYALGIGYAVQWVFNWFDFDTKKVIHRSVMDDYRWLKGMNVAKEKI